MNTIFIALCLLSNPVWSSNGKCLTQTRTELISNVMHHKNVWITIDIGDCKECGRNLEKFLIKQNGIVTVEFARKFKTLKVVYDPVGISEAEIHKKIAGQGYDTDIQLMGCCKYRK